MAKIIIKCVCICSICSAECFVDKSRGLTWTKCATCAKRINGQNNKGKKRTAEQNRANSLRGTGENNPFFGRRHTEETKEKIRNREITDTQRSSARETLKRNRNRRKIFDIWVDELGAEAAERRLDEYRQLQSENNRGAGNPMFGKPAPKGSGRGWSGWIDSIFFRSKMELSFIVHMLREGILFESAEKKRYGIEYVVDDNIKTYYTDFYLVESGEFIEIKPRNLLGFGTNPEKFAAARRIHGDNFKIFTEDDFHILERREIDELYENGRIEWVERFDKKYRESNPDKGVS